MYKKIISIMLVLILTLSLAACGTGSKTVSEQQSPPVYIETEIGSSSGVVWPGGSRVNSKNQLMVYDRGDGTNSGFVILEKDGKPTGASRLSFAGNVRAFALDAQDNIYAITAEPQGGKAVQKLTILNSQGDTLKTIELGGISGAGNGGGGVQNTGFTDIAVNSEGNIYLTNPAENIQVLDNEGQLVKTLGSQGYESIDVDLENNVIALSLMGKRAIDKLDATTGKSIWSTDLSSDNSGGMIMIGSNKIRYSKADNSIYHLTGQGVAKYDSRGKLEGTAVDFKAYTILASGYNISDVCIDADGSIYITSSSAPVGGMKVKTPGNSGPDNPQQAAARDIKYEIYRYSIGSGENTAQKQEVITVSVPVSNRALEIAAAKFQKDNPEYRVDIQTYPSGDYETYVKNLNTQILSGKGPDIISVAGLPYESYASKNILADIGNMMAEDSSFDMSKYYTNIFDAMKYDGKLYVLPTDFSFNVLMANQEILNQEAIKIDDSKWTWNDFREIAGKVTQQDGSSDAAGRAALPSVSSSELLNLFTGGSYRSFIESDSKKAGFTTGGFADLLNTVKAFNDEKLVNSNVKNDMVSVLDAAGRGSIVFYPYSITDYNMYSFMKSAFNEQLSLYNIPTTGGTSSGTFTSNAVYSINRNSAHKEASWELLKVLISDEVQSQEVQGAAVQGKSANGALRAMGGFSVNKYAQQQKAQRVIDASKGGTMKMMMKGPNGSISLSPAAMSQEDIDLINAFIAELDIYANADANINSIIQDEIKAFFNGDKSAEETAKLIQGRANTYLGE